MSTSNEDIRDSVKRMAHTLQKIEAVCIDALMTRPYKPDEARQHFSEALAEIRKLCPEPFGNVADVKVLPIPNANDQLGTGNIGNSSPFPLPPSPKDWLEMPRGIKLQRFSNTKRETHFVGQYRDMNPISGNPTPRRVYTIDVMPMIDDSECKEFEVWVKEDHKKLFSVLTTRGRAMAEYLGVKGLKAWLHYAGDNRRGKQSLKKHRRRSRGKGKR